MSDGIIAWTHKKKIKHYTLVNTENTVFSGKIEVRAARNLFAVLKVPSVTRNKQVTFKSLSQGSSIGFSGFITVRSVRALPAVLKVPSYTRNKRITFKGLPVEHSDFQGHIQVVRRSDMAANIVITPSTYMEGAFEVYGVGDHNLISKITVRTHQYFPSVISIPPRNRMTVLVDIQPIPRTEETIYPIKDAFYRSGVPRLNYGKEQSMTIGRIENSTYSGDGKEEFRAVLQFDLSHLPQNVEIEKAVLRLYATKPLREHVLKVFNNLSDWSENIVAWINQPSTSEEYVEGRSNEGDSYIEIDVKTLVKRWAELKDPNYGFQIHSALDQIIEQSFYTREYIDPKYRPQLELRYFNKDLIVSIGRVPLRGSITVRQHKNKDLQSKITIKSHFASYPLPGSLEVVNPNYRTGVITVSRSHMQGRVLVSKLDPSGLRGSITIMNNRDFDFDGSVLVNKRFMPSKLIVPVLSEVPSSIIVRQTKDKDLGGVIEINKPILAGNIEIPHSSTLPGIIYIPGEGEKDLFGSIEVNQKHIVGNITVIAQRSLDGVLKVAKHGHDESFTGVIEVRDSKSLAGRIEVIKASNIPSSLTVRSGNMHGIIYIPGEGESWLTGSLRIVRNEEDTQFKGVITVAERNNLDAAVIVKESKTLKGKIQVERANYLNASISVVSPNLPSVIIIPGYGDSQFSGDITVRVKMVNDLLSSITVENPRYLPCTITVVGQDKDKNSYAFIL